MSSAQNMPIMKVSRIRNEIMYSLTLTLTLSQLAKIVIGVNSVVNSTNSMEIPSTPIL